MRADIMVAIWVARFVTHLVMGAHAQRIGTYLYFEHQLP